VPRSSTSNADLDGGDGVERGGEGGVVLALVLGERVELLDDASGEVVLRPARHGHHRLGVGTRRGGDGGVLLRLHHSLEAVDEADRVDGVLAHPVGGAVDVAGDGVRDRGLGVVLEVDGEAVLGQLVGPGHRVDPADAVVGGDHPLVVLVGHAVGGAVLQVVRGSRPVAEAVGDRLDVHADDGVVAVVDSVALTVLVGRLGDGFHVAVGEAFDVGDRRAAVGEELPDLPDVTGQAVDRGLSVAQQGAGRRGALPQGVGDADDVAVAAGRD
jgi:hypothetical protein